MSVSSGAEGITGGGAPSDLDVIYQGGQHFLDRMKAMSDAREAAEKAFKELALGNDIAAARASTEADVKKAKAAQESAQAALAEAQQRAAAIIEDSQSQAKAVIDAAQQRAQDMIHTADAVKADADTYAAKVKLEADATLAQVNERLRDITVNAAAVKAKVDAAEKAEAAANESRTKLDAVRAVYEQKVAQLQAVMAAPDTER